jgi:hypothetical protein
LGTPCVPPGSYGAGDLKSRDGAPRGARVDRKTRPRRKRGPKGATRRSVPSASRMPEDKRKARRKPGGNTAYPAPLRTGALLLAHARTAGNALAASPKPEGRRRAPPRTGALMLAHARTAGNALAASPKPEGRRRAPPRIRALALGLPRRSESEGGLFDNWIGLSTKRAAYSLPLSPLWERVARAERMRARAG